MIIGAGLKMYLGHRATLDWLAAVAELARGHPGLRSGAVELFVLPTFPCLPAAVQLLSPVGVAVGAQDLSTADAGAHTGQVSGAELAEIGCRYAEVGHMERRRLGEDDAVVAAKTAAAYRHGLTPVICVGESDPTDPVSAAAFCRDQLQASLARARAAGRLGPALVAYEPHWAIGAAAAAPADHVAGVCAALTAVLAGDPGLAGSRVLYGGSAGPGLLARLTGAVDGLFVGRASHTVASLAAILDDAAHA